MEEELVAFLLADAALAALVGRRIKWLERPQGSGLPAITLQLASGVPEYTMRGRIRLAGPLVQFDVWAGTFASMIAVERALRSALDGLRVLPFQGAFVTGWRHSSEPQGAPDADGSSSFYRSSIDARIWHAAAA